jgi:hypothetical protein
MARAHALGLALSFAGALHVARASAQGTESAAPIADASQAEAPELPSAIGKYSPTLGFKLAETELGSVNFRGWTYVRYLNQLALDETYTDAFGQTTAVQRRHDMQFQKVMLYFSGFLLDPSFRYLLYVWSSNTSQGLGAQVVVNGNLNYTWSDYLTLGAGVSGLPGVRSLEGSSPFWLSVDSRMIADEFFRPSYTAGIWATGELPARFKYNVMLGNNLSQLGVDAGQLDSGLNTVSAALAWFPTTGEFGFRGRFGDYDEHEHLATRFAAHFTRSPEDRTSQPDTEDFENVQIRLSDGNVVFEPNLFGPGIVVTNATYTMTATDFGLKFRGFSLDGEYYLRWVTEFSGPGSEIVDDLFDHGFQAQASAMVWPKTVQLYAGTSKIFGQYGDPWDVRAGASWFPWHSAVARLNAEWMYLDRSPVGNFSLPYPVGAQGNVFYANLEVSM